MNAGTLNWQTICDVAIKQHPFVLVSVFCVKGSSPREEGTKMLVSAEGVLGTIGGGNMEFQAIKLANELMNPSHEAGFKIIEAPLTPKFDQCCGGQVTLVYEKILPSRQHWTFKLIELFSETDKIGQANTNSTSRATSKENMGLMTQKTTDGVKRYLASASDLNEQTLLDGFFDPLRSPSTLKIFLFGAGHVGKALVRSLRYLDVDISWVDHRDAIFPSIDTYKVKCLQTNDWQKVIDHAPSNSYFLVMTHSHQLDYALTEAILEKDDFQYFGLIGSAKKRQRFERQLLKNTRLGLSTFALDKMTCPIGLASISGKAPEIIAASVTAELLIVSDTFN